MNVAETQAEPATGAARAAAAYRDEGMSVEQTAVLLGWSVRRTRATLVAAGVQIRGPKRRSRADPATGAAWAAAAYRDEGMSVEQTAEEIGWSVRRTRKALADAGVQIRGPKRRSSPELIAEVCRRYLAGERGDKIAADVGVAHSTMYEWLDKNGIARRPRRVGKPAKPPTPEMMAKATQLYCVGRQSLAQVASACGIGSRQAREVLTAAGVQIRSSGPTKGRASPPQMTAKVVELYCVGLHSVKQVAAACGIGDKRARKILADAGVQIRGGGQVKDRPWRRMRHGLPPSPRIPGDEIPATHPDSAQADA